MSTVTNIMEALTNPDASIRLPAEQQVVTAQQSDFAGFCVALLNELKDESKPEGSRSLAGILLKNSVALDAKNSEKRKELDHRWTNLGPEIRGEVKNTVLETLGSTNKNVRLIASLIIANIARTELPFNEWPQLIDTLVNACGSGDVKSMEAALTALGYVCQEADAHDNMAKVMTDQSEKILCAICAGMERSSELEVIGAATRALANSMDFVHDHMKKEDVQRYLITTICDTIEQCPDASIRESAMVCLVRVAELYYTILPNFIDRLFQVTSNAIKCDEEPVILQALLFWITIGEQEMDQPQPNHEFMKKGGRFLVDISITCLQQQEDEQTEEDWNVSTAGSNLLRTIAEVIRDDVVGHAMPFIYANVDSQDWRKREAALMAFGCILNGPSPDFFADTVAQSINALMGDLQHSHLMVCDTAGWVLACVCQSFPLIFTEGPQQMKKLMDIIGPMINGPNSFMCIRACNIVHNLALMYQDEDEQDLLTNSLSPYFMSLCEVLIQRIDRVDGAATPSMASKERTTATETLNCLIDAAAKDMRQAVESLLPTLTQRLGAMVETYARSPSDDILLEQGLMCGSLSAIAKKINNKLEPFLPNIMNLLGVIFGQQQHSTLEEAIALLGTLSVCCPRGFVPYVDSTFPTVLKCAFTVEEEDLCLAATGTIGDLAGSLPQIMVQHLPVIMSGIFNALKEPEVNRDLKLAYLGSVGDIALHCCGLPGQVTYPLAPYINEIFTIAFQFFQQSLTIDMTDSLDNEDYVFSLWTCLCEVCSQIAQSLREHPADLLLYVTAMINLGNHVCRSSASSDVFAAGVTLFGDLANVFLDTPTAESKAAVLLPVVMECVMQGVSSKEENLNEKARWARTQLYKLEKK